MHSERPIGSARRIAIALLALSLALAGCVSIDRYASSSRFDAGSADSSSDVTLPDATIEQCSTCLESQCDSEWTACESDPNCRSCLFDPFADDCMQSLQRRPLRNCACIPSTCVKDCRSLCFTAPPASQVSAECISCTTTKCGQFISACIGDSVCFACITDATNPRCAANPAWANTTTCLCNTRNTCFDECVCQIAPD